MIRVMDYGIEAGDNCFQVGKITTSTDKKTGERRDTLSSPAYVTTIRGAFEIIRKKLLLQQVKTLDCGLDEAVHVLKQTEEQFYQLLEKIKW